MFTTTLDFINYVLSLIGEQPLYTSAGNLGQLVRNSIYTSMLGVVQTSRASMFEQYLTATVVNLDSNVPAYTIPDDLVQLLNVSFVDATLTKGLLVSISRKEVISNNAGYYYEVVGNSLYLSQAIDRPVQLKLRALVVPTLPTADDAPIALPKPVLPAIAHGAASILCLSYVDDANASSMHKRMADEATNMLRQQFGITRGRAFNMRDTREFYA